MDHIFAVAAYGKSPFLKACLISLKNMRGGSQVIVCTSTPCDFISSTAAEFGYEVFAREGESSIRDDWNFCVEMAAKKKAKFVTVAHQDDIYGPDYLSTLKKAASLYPDMSLFCSDYQSIDKEGLTINTRLENVKRLLRLGLRFRKLSHLKPVKRSALCFGNSICCPSCTYSIERTPLPIFRGDYKFVTDWDALIRLSDMPGRFVCSEKKLVKHRIHPHSQTLKTMDDDTRKKEEASLFKCLWPYHASAILSTLMHLAYGAYR